MYLDMRDPDQWAIEIHSLSGNWKKQKVKNLSNTMSKVECNLMPKDRFQIFQIFFIFALFQKVAREITIHYKSKKKMKQQIT